MGSQSQQEKLKAKAEQLAAAFKKAPKQGAPRSESRILRILHRLHVPHAIDPRTGMIALSKAFGLHWTRLYPVWAFWVDEWQTSQAPDILTRAPTAAEEQAALHRLIQTQTRFAEQVTPYFFPLVIGVVELPNQRFAVYQQTWTQGSALPDGSQVRFATRSRFTDEQTAVSEARKFLRQCRLNYATFLDAKQAQEGDADEQP